MRGILETEKQFLSSWSSRGRFIPALEHQPPQFVGETQRLSVEWLLWTLAFLHSDYYCVWTEVMKGAEARQNLPAGERMNTEISATSSPRR